MKTNSKYRGQLANEKDVTTIRKIIAEITDAGKRFISQDVCRARRWTQTNSVITDMICRILLILMESIGLIKQSQPKRIATNPPANRKKPDRTHVDQSSIEWTIKEPLQIQRVQVRKSRQDRLYNGIVDGRHYLVCIQPVGENSGQCTTWQITGSMQDIQRLVENWAIPINPISQKNVLRISTEANFQKSV